MSTNHQGTFSYFSQVCANRWKNYSWELISSSNRPRRHRDSRKIHRIACQTTSHRAHGGESFHPAPTCYPISNVTKVSICPMYAALPHSQQVRIFASTPPNTRKCILATNIAETSITIPGIKYVIDTGKCKENRYLSKDTGCGKKTLLHTRNLTVHPTRRFRYSIDPRHYKIIRHAARRSCWA